jgi:hypothetical protein
MNMAFEDSDILTQLAQAPPNAASSQDADSAKAALDANSAQKLVDAAVPRPLGQPDASGWRQSIDVAKDAAASKPAPAPGSFADHLSNALTDARKNADAAVLSEPGSWSKLMVGATMDALTKVGQPVKPPTPALRGPWSGATSNADATRPTVAPVAPKAPFGQPVMGLLADLAGPERGLAGFAKATTQRQAEEQKERVLLASSNAQMLHEQALTHKLGEDQIQAAVSSGKAGMDALVNAEKPATVVTEGKTSDELKTMIDKGEIDPTKQTVFLTGRIQTGTDKNGQPLFRSTYSVVNPAGEVKLKDDEAKYINDNLHMELKPGQPLEALQFNHLWQQAQGHEASTGARKLALAKIGEQVDKANLDSEANNIGRDPKILGAITAAQSSPDDPHALVKAFNALINNKEFMQSHPNFTQTYPRWAGGGDAKKFETMQENYAKAQDKAKASVDEMLTKAENDPKEIEGHTPAFAAAMRSIIGDPNAPADKKKRAAAILATVGDVRQGEIDLEKAKAEGKKEAQEGFKGNPNATSPEDFLASLKPEEQSIVNLIHSGRAPMVRLEYLVSRKPEVLEAVERAYPGQFDGSKVKGYVDTYKDFTSGKTSVNLNAGATALQHLNNLKKINDANPVDVRNPLTAAYKAYNNLLDTVADELVTFYGEPKTNETIASKKRTLGGLLNRDAAITEQANAMGVKFDSYEQTWKNAAPSKSYQAPMPYISEAAKQARADLDPEYAKRLNAEKQNGPAAVKLPAGPKVIPNKGFKVGDPFMQNGHKMTVKAVDENGKITDAE